MQLKPELGVQLHSCGVFFSDGQGCEMVWIVEDLLHEKSAHPYSLAPWMYRNSNKVEYACPVVREDVPNHFSPKDSYESWPPAQFVPDGVITHPVLVEELFFELSDGSRITRKRVTELVVPHVHQG